jgi:uncharacterized membrane-anchored protein
MTRRHLLLFGGLALVLGAANFAIVDKERLLANGTTVLVELAPVDPRSLIQGDYMRLDYAIARNGQTRNEIGSQRTGRIVVHLDDRGVAQFVRAHRGEALARGELLLQYRVRGNRLRIGSDAYFFEEGSAARYISARYGELRVDDDGESVLVGLRDGELKPLND